jgi:hypothetical protein
MLTDEGLDRPLAESDRAPVLDPCRVTLIPVEGVRRASEFVSGFGDGQETIAASRSPEGEEKCDDLRE